MWLFNNLFDVISSQFTDALDAEEEKRNRQTQNINSQIN